MPNQHFTQKKLPQSKLYSVFLATDASKNVAVLLKKCTCSCLENVHLLTKQKLELIVNLQKIATDIAISISHLGNWLNTIMLLLI